MKLFSTAKRLCLEDSAHGAIPVACQNLNLRFQMVNIQRHIYGDFYIPPFDIWFLPDSTCAGNTHEVPISIATAVKVFEHQGCPSWWRGTESGGGGPGGADLHWHYWCILLSRHAVRWRISEAKSHLKAWFSKLQNPFLWSSGKLTYINPNIHWAHAKLWVGTFIKELKGLLSVHF